MTAFDTNILIYSCDLSDSRRQRIALEILAAAEDGVLLWQVAAEFVAASRKLSAQGFTPAHAWARFARFQERASAHYPVGESLRPCANIARTSLSFWDAMIIGACIDCGVDLLYSEDLPGRTHIESLRIENPFT